MTENDPAEIEFTPSTTMIAIHPTSDPEVAAFYNEALKAEKYANARVIEKDGDLAPATDDLAMIATVLKGMDNKRKEYLKPWQQHVKDTNEAYKILMTPIESADQTTRGKILTYRQQVAAKIAAIEEANRLRMEAAQVEAGANNGEITESVGLVEPGPAAPDKVHGFMGTSGIAKIRKFEVIDQAALPEEYKIPDMTKIGKVVRAGADVIAGVRIWEEDSLKISKAK